MKFFVLEDPVPTGRRNVTEYMDVEPCHVGEFPECRVCRGTLAAAEWLPPYRVDLKLWGKTFGDIVFGTCEPLLVSKRFRTLWQREGLIGLESFSPVEVRKVKRYGWGKNTRSRRPPYYVVQVMRAKAAVDDACSGIDRGGWPICPACRLAKGKGCEPWSAERIIIEAGTWSGEDLFIARGLPNMYIASERFRAFCKEHKMANVLLIPAEKYVLED